MASITAIVLAAGLSSRMEGKQKLFLSYQGKTILEQVISQLQESSADEIIVVSSPLTHDKIDSMSLSGITLCTNPEHKQGMTTSIQRGVEAASADSDGFMICLGDMPRITTKEYDKLAAVFSSAVDNDERTILLPFYKRQKGNPVIFSGAYRNKILTHQEMEGCKAIVQNSKQHLTKVEMVTDHVLMDVDTQEDYRGLPNL